MTSGRTRVALAAVLAGVQLLAVLDSLAAALALPQISHSLDLGTAGAAWILNSTSVALAGGLLLAGRLGDLWGERRLFLAGTALKAAGSVIAGLAPGLAVLLTGRVLIGLGAALAFPAALALTGSSFPVEPWRSRALAVTATAGAAGSIGGAVYGGVVTGLLGWRWVFWLTVPVTLALWVAARHLLPHPASTGRQGRSVDLAGAGLATVTLAGVAAGVIGLGTGSTGTATASGLLVLACVAAGVLVLHERRAADPLLPPTVVGSHRLLAGCAGMAAGSALWTAVVFVHAQQLQADGWSAARAGVAILPASVGIVVAGLLVVPRASRRYGAGRVATVGLAVSAGCLTVLAAARDASWAATVLPALVAFGGALSAIRVGLIDLALGDSPAGTHGVSAAVFESSAHVGGAVSVAAYAAAMAAGGFALAYLVGSGLGVLGLVGVITLCPGRALRHSLANVR